MGDVLLWMFSIASAASFATEWLCLLLRSWLISQPLKYLAHTHVHEGTGYKRY